MKDKKTKPEQYYIVKMKNKNGGRLPDEREMQENSQALNLLIKHGIDEQIFAQVLSILNKHNLILKKGTIVDSTLIAAPSSTKNADRKRDPEAHSVKKGNQWYFGYKAHIGVDKDTGLVHHVKATAANVHDTEAANDLIHGDEDEIYGDSGYLNVEHVFGVVKRLFRFRRTQYKGLRKQQAKFNMIFALANLYLADKKNLPA